MASQRTKQLIKHIDDGVAMEQNVLRMLDSMLETTEDAELQRALEAHKRTTREHAERLEQRLKAHGTSPSRTKRAGGVLGARAKTIIDLGRRNKAGRNALDGFATEQREIATYELLERIARQAGDEETAEVARQNRAEDQAMAKKIAGNWDALAELALANGDSKGGGGLRQRASRVNQLVQKRPFLAAAGALGVGLALGRRGQGGQSEQSDAQEQEEALELLSKQELQERATSTGISVPRNMTKQDLVEAIRSQGSAQGSTPRANPIQVQKFLEGVGYPRRRDDLVKEAERQGASPRVRSTLERLPNTTFQTPAEVSEAIGKLP